MRSRSCDSICSQNVLIFLCSHSVGDVDLLELVETSQDTSAGHTTEDVGSSTLHHGHEAFVLEDLDTGADGHTPTQKEGQEQGLVVSQEDGLEGVVHAEVHATVDEDADARDGETTVQALDTVGLEGLPVDVNEAVVLALSTLALSVVSQPGTGVVKGVDEQKGERTGTSTRENIL